MLITSYYLELDANTGVDMTFSSYPGLIHSSDDFYITSNNLLVTETTLEVIDVNEFKKKKPSDQYIFNYIRVTGATREAKSAVQS